MMKTDFTYTEKNGIFYADVTISHMQQRTVGKYGLLHLNYIKAHRQGRYNLLHGNGTLNEYLCNIDTEAHNALSALIEKLASRQGITESLKAENQLLWVQKMNNAKAQAEEIVLNEIIYR